MTDHKTIYQDGCLIIAKRNGLLSYFAAKIVDGKLLSGPSQWGMTLDNSASFGEKTEAQLTTTQAAYRWLEACEKELFDDVFGVTEVNEEFLLSYDAVDPENWLRLRSK